ncbi:phorbol ester/diacylglycerol-binding protein unc-13, partial [Elysia marginata]
IFVIVQDIMMKAQFGIFPLALFINMINISVFLKMGVKDAMTLSLLSLSISDFLELCIGTTLITLDAIRSSPLESRAERYVDLVGLYYWIVLFALIGQSTSTNITTLIALERCLCVVAPFKLKSIVTMKRTSIAILCVVVFGVMCNLPNFLTAHFVLVFNPRLNVTRVEVLLLKERRLAEEMVLVFNHWILYPISVVIVVTSSVIMIRGLRQSAKFRQNQRVRQVEEAEGLSRVKGRVRPETGGLATPTLTPGVSSHQQGIIKDMVEEKHDRETSRGRISAGSRNHGIKHGADGISGNGKTHIATNCSSSDCVVNENKGSKCTSYNSRDEKSAINISDAETNDNYKDGIKDVFTSKVRKRLGKESLTSHAQGPDIEPAAAAASTPANNTTRPRPLISRNNIRLVKMLLVVASVTAVFHVISILIGLWFIFERELKPDGYYSNAFNVVVKGAQIYYAFSMSINIFVYIKYNRKFRQTFLAMWFRVFPCFKLASDD